MVESWLDHVLLMDGQNDACRVGLNAWSIGYATCRQKLNGLLLRVSSDAHGMWPGPYIDLPLWPYTWTPTVITTLKTSYVMTIHMDTYCHDHTWDILCNDHTHGHLLSWPHLKHLLLWPYLRHLLKWPYLRHLPSWPYTRTSSRTSSASYISCLLYIFWPTLNASIFYTSFISYVYSYLSFKFISFISSVFYTYFGRP